MYNKKIIDVCCGSKRFYFDKQNPIVLFQDIRSGDYSTYGKQILVTPDVVGDFRNMKFEDESFYLVVFDPPHLLYAGDGIFRAQYGVLDRNTWREDIAKGFEECWRILKPNGALIFKWAELHVKLSDVLSLFSQKPVFGNRRVGEKSGTHWLVFFKEEVDKEKDDRANDRQGAEN